MRFTKIPLAALYIKVRCLSKSTCRHGGRRILLRQVDWMMADRRRTRRRSVYSPQRGGKEAASHLRSERSLPQQQQRGGGSTAVWSGTFSHTERWGEWIRPAAWDTILADGRHDEPLHYVCWAPVGLRLPLKDLFFFSLAHSLGMRLKDRDEPFQSVPKYTAVRGNASTGSERL